MYERIYCIGTKEIEAIKMNRLNYNKLRGWDLPANENGNDEGYLVEYLDGGQANHPEFKGYISWSPKDVFERAYQPSGSMSFGAALVALKAGKKVARSGWNGKGMFCIYVPRSTGVTFNEGTPYANAVGTEPDQEILPHIDMWTINAKGRRAMLPGWLASQSDMLADDWEILL